MNDVIREFQATATWDGFTDSAGRQMTYEEGLLNAARCIMDQGEMDYVVELLRDQPPEDVLAWIVYPDTGRFA